MKKGYTLIEMLVVIVIIGIILSIGLISYASIGKQARDAKRKDDLQTLQKEFEMYYQINSSYPVGASADLCYASLVASITTAKHPKDPDDTDLEYVWDCSPQAYCICTNSLEIPTKGNASDTLCTFADSGAYYCVRNQQTLDVP